MIPYGIKYFLHNYQTSGYTSQKSWYNAKTTMGGPSMFIHRFSSVLAGLPLQINKGYNVISFMFLPVNGYYYLPCLINTSAS